jgi:dihydrofolate reductase
MRKLIVSTFMTLDGVIDPVEGWPTLRGEHMAHGLDQLRAADALVLGRKTYEGLAAAWSKANDELGYATAMNSLPKFVASRTLKEPLSWNAQLLGSDLVKSVASLKAQPGRNLLMYGCGDLAHYLAARGLVDELRCWVQPITWAKGRHLFHENEPLRLQLTATTTFDSDVTLLCYRPMPGRLR